MRISRTVPLAAWSALVLLAGCEFWTVADGPTPLGIVLMIGDGMGYGHLDAARSTGGPLVIETLPLRGELITASANDEVTDSGAAATALASGVLTNNYAVGVDVDGQPVRTVVAAALARGMATGLVSTAHLVSATPAAFLAHVPDRNMMEEIAGQMAASGVHVLFGGGRHWFMPEGRRDRQDLVAAFRIRGCEYGESASLLLLAGTRDCMVGLFASVGMPFATAGRTPTLAEMATSGLAAVRANPNGFFLLVESDEIDKRAHANDTAGVIAEVRAFDEAVAAVLNALGNRPNTLVIVTADHETGGLSVVNQGPLPTFRWSTNLHTASPIPIFASGPGADRFSGTHSISRVGAVLLAMVRGE